MIASAIVGVAAFVGVLMFGPSPADSHAPRTGRVPTGPGFAVRPQGVQGQARAFVAQGLDFAAIALLDDHLEATPDDAWAAMFATQLSLRARTGKDGPTETSEALLTLATATLARLEHEDRLPRVDADSNYTNWFIAGWAARAAGDETRARQTFLDGLAQNERQTTPDSVGRLYDGACLLALAGETDDAVARIERLGEIGYNNAQWLRQDPDLQSLQADPRFLAVIQRLEAAQDQARRQAERDLLGPAAGQTPSGETGP